ncbi:hypothetical protein CEXT_3261 [Caerostris extrusa]|uniref:Uncharacterized protein n=1 Tax=Caerostris extrusa TaxID=172846 RepID=A0AAV4SFD7_CAEEX|nr:hypothetical protein CEXT_3261 [Caerostris extrusa]
MSDRQIFEHCWCLSKTGSFSNGMYLVDSILAIIELAVHANGIIVRPIVLTILHIHCFKESPLEFMVSSYSYHTLYTIGEGTIKLFCCAQIAGRDSLSVEPWFPIMWPKYESNDANSR